ncbi:MAG TPA: hypothetical protein VHZ74_07960 [Bryobacteraceae bacterium]|nr:hypothetical protein [Bryobacteraceae bacterium]
MKHRALMMAAISLAASAVVFGQAGLTGKWQTDNVPAALEAQKNAPAAEPGAGRGRGAGGAQAIILDLQTDASGKISGTVTEIGNPPVLNIESGTITGKTVTWVTQPRGVTWNLEMTDDNTLTLTGRVFAGRGGGGRAPGAAPAAGGEPPAGGAPPAGAATGGDGTPRAGGGRGFGRGAQQPIVLHRVK